MNSSFGTSTRRPAASTGGVAEHLEKAAIFEQWATDADSYTLDGALTPAHLLIVAAEHLQMAHDTDEAFRLVEAAMAHSSVKPFEAHPTLISLHLEQEDRVTALALADEVRTTGSDDLGVYQQIAEGFEIAGELALAERWYAIALRALDKVGLESPSDRIALLAGATASAATEANRSMFSTSRPSSSAPSTYLTHSPDLAVREP